MWPSMMKVVLDVSRIIPIFPVKVLQVEKCTLAQIIPIKSQYISLKSDVAAKKRKKHKNLTELYTKKRLIILGGS